MRSALKRVAVDGQLQHKFKHKTFPAPTAGWVVSDNLSTQRPASALILENWFPTTTGARVRGGSSKWATITSGGPALTMFTYTSGSVSKFFASDETNIFDITSVVDVDAIPTAAVTGQTSGNYSPVEMVTVAGEYLIVVNGEDDAQLYDGSTWQALNAVSTPSITGVATADLSNGWVFANRVFFVESGTLNSWYLPVDSIGGLALDFSLAGVFKKGGALLFGGTWSLDSGSGLDDKCIFVSTEGEVAIYQGIDPSNASTWALVGVYEITKPMGAKATMRAGGDLLIAAEDGIIPLTEAIRKDPAALSLAAVTKNIEPVWKKEVVSRRTLPWEILKWPSNNMLIVSQPITDTQSAQCLVANIETGAWCKFTGWDTRCMALFNNFGYFGTNDGRVMQMEVGGNDDGAVYTAFYAGGFDHLSSPGSEKVVHQFRETYLSASPFNSQASVSVDFSIEQPVAPNAIADYIIDEWDVGKWDQGQWDGGEETFSVSSRWRSIGRQGRAISPQIQITCGVTPFPRIELVNIDMTYTEGGLVV